MDSGREKGRYSSSWILWSLGYDQESLEKLGNTNVRVSASLNRQKIRGIIMEDLAG